MTNTGILTAPDGSIVLIDPGVFPDELAGLAERVGDRRTLAAISTHEDWDHVLWSADFPDDIPRLAHPAVVRILEKERNQLIASLSAAENDLGVTWNHDLAGRLQPASSTSFTLGHAIRITTVPTPGHTNAHTSLWLEDEGILFAGDMLSDVDIPMLMPEPDAATRYLASLDDLTPIIASAVTIIPGHGTPCGRGEAQLRLQADRAYIEALLTRTHGPAKDLPSLEDLAPGDARTSREENADAHRRNAATLRM